MGFQTLRGNQNSPVQSVVNFKSTQGVGSLCFVTFTRQVRINGLTFHTFDMLEESQHDCTLHSVSLLFFLCNVLIASYTNDLNPSLVTENLVI